MPRPDLPDGLIVSVSQIRTWMTCSRRYELKYVRGLAPAFVPAAMALGSAFHESLASYYVELKHTGMRLARDLVVDVFHAAWERQCSGPVPLQPDGEDDVSVTALGVSMLHAFYESACRTELQVEEVEKSFVVELYDPDTGEVLEEKLVGTIDLVAMQDGVRTIWEHKTAVRKYSDDQLRYDIQPTAYRLAARQMGLGSAVATKFHVITKSKTPSVQVADAVRTEQDESDFLRIAVGVLKAIDAGVSFPVRGWQCRSCPFAYACK